MADITIVKNEDNIKKLKRAIAYGMLNLGFYIETQAKSHVPVKTGNLRRSIHTVGFQDGKTLANTADRKAPDYGQLATGTGVIVGTNTGYGLFVELGTVHMHARPFLIPAAQEALAKGTELILSGAKQNLEGGGGGA